MAMRILGLLLVGVLLTPAFAADDKKPTGKDDKAKHIDSDTLPSASYTGKLLDVPDKGGTFAAQVDFSHYAPRDPKKPNLGVQDMERLTREQTKVADLQTEVANAKTAKEQQHKTKELEKAMAELQKLTDKVNQDYKLVTEHKNVDFLLSRDATVRVMLLPPRFDDDGKVKPYSDDEKKDLRGKDSQLPGYEAKLSDLKIGDQVRIRLWRKPETKPADNAAPTKSTSEDSGSDKTPAEKKSQVTLIVILNDNLADKDKDTTKDKPKDSTSK